jgi:hypothetical protein
MFKDKVEGSGPRIRLGLSVDFMVNLNVSG